jgi:hypothetical protein
LIDGEYLTEEVWWRKAILNVARIGKFSSDRSVTQYARDIWHIGPFERSSRAAKPPVRSVTPTAKVNGDAPTAEPVPEAETKHVAD